MKNHPVCSSCECLKSCLFRSASGPEIQHIVTVKSSREYKKNQILYQEGERPQGIYCIASGKVKVTKTNKEGKEQIVRIVIAGDNIGQHSILGNDYYSDSAIVIDEAVVCFIPRNDFLDMAFKNSRISQDLLRRLSVDFMEVEELLKHMAFKSVRERMAEAFLSLKKTYNHSGNTELQISISRGDLANIVGTAKETATRLLTEFKEDNIISIEGKDITVRDWDKLNKISRLYD